MLFINNPVFSTVGDIMIHVGRYLEYRGGCSVPWGYHDQCGDILSTVGGGGVQDRGWYHECHGGYLEHRRGYHEYPGGVQYRKGYHPL